MLCDDNPIFVSMLRDFSNFKTFRNKWVRAILKSDADTMLVFSLILLRLIPSPQMNSEEHEHRSYAGRKVALKRTELVKKGGGGTIKEAAAHLKPASFCILC